MKVHIPASIDEAKQALNGLGAWLTAKEWERAAIVYAFTESDNGGRPRKDETRAVSERVSYTAFAALGITGLRTRQDVAEYRKAWQEAIAAGAAEPVAPGDDVALPELEWKKFFGEPTPEVQNRVAKAVMRDPVRVAAIIRADPVARTSVVEASVRVAPSEVITEQYRQHPMKSIDPTALPKRDYDMLVRRALGDLTNAVEAEAKGEWTPRPSSLMALAFIPALFSERNADDRPVESVHDQIAAFLAAERTQS